MGRLWAGTLLCLLSGCSLILDFGGDITDAGGDPDDAGPDFCDTDEPNNTQAMATPVEDGMRQAAICPKGDVDFYSFTVDGAQDMIAELSFDNRGGLGDLDMLLFSETGAQLLPAGDGFGDVETIDRSEASANGRLPAGTYALRVFAFDNQRENTYTFTLTLDPPTGSGPDAGVGPDAGLPDAGL